MRKLQRQFYNRDTVTVAKDLLGKLLVRMVDGTPLVGRITETEAYVGPVDKACHAYHYRRTPRTETLFAPPGTAYIYLIYGMHCCLNFVTEPEGEPSAVLLRSVEPVYGADTICQARFGSSIDQMTPYQRKNFMNGPGKVCKGLFLSTNENAMDLTGDELFLCNDPEDIGLPSPPLPAGEVICCGPRIGVDYAGEDKDLPWRFWLKKEATKHV